MGEPPDLVDLRSHRPLVRVSRRQVLTVLRDANRAMAISEVADRLGLHPNTVRLHLESLVEAGLVTRGTERRDGRGRPRALYAARPAPQFEATRDDRQDGDQGYRLLAEVLANHLESTASRPPEEAAAAGRAWGHLLADQMRSSAAPEGPLPSVGEVTEELAGLLDDLGFAPGAAVAGDTIELHRCPFGQVAERHSVVVCAVHLGLMQGVLSERGALLRATSVEPFVTPQMCLARLEATASVGAGQSGSGTSR